MADQFEHNGPQPETYNSQFHFGQSVRMSNVYLQENATHRASSVRVHSNSEFDRSTFARQNTMNAVDE